jgi:hypothetical protein
MHVHTRLSEEVTRDLLMAHRFDLSASPSVDVDLHMGRLRALSGVGPTETFSVSFDMFDAVLQLCNRCTMKKVGHRAEMSAMVRVCGEVMEERCASNVDVDVGADVMSLFQRQELTPCEFTHKHTHIL